MATKISEYSSTPASNTDLDGINLSEDVMVPSDVNDALRMQMAHLKDMDTGTSALTSPELTSATISGGTIDNTVVGGTTAATGSFTNVTVSGTVDGRDVSVDGAKLDGIEASADVTDATNVAAAGALMTAGGTMTGNINFGDSDRAIFGAGSDLQIYHNAIHSYIDNNTGNIYIRSNVDDDDGGNIILEAKAGESGIIIADDGDVSLYFNGNPKLATTNTGVDVTGTVVSDGLTMDGNIIQSGAGSKTISLERVGASKLDIGASTAGVGNFITTTTNDLFVKRTTSSTKVLGVGNSTGDISFYDNTGVSQGFFWDANEQRLGLGTTTPTNLITIDSTSDLTIRYSTNGTFKGYVGVATTAGKLMTGSTIDELVVRSTDGIAFAANNARAMTIDSSGEFLVGKTAADVTTTGFRVEQAGTTFITRGDNRPLILNRQASNGSICDFRQANTTVGVIGVDSDSTNLMIGNGVVGLRFVEGSNHIRPANTDTGGNRDNAIDLGYGSSRFKNLYLSGGVYLGGTGSANYLDDYEEGTWTANINFGSNTGSSTGATYFQSTGNYVKIGNLVHVQCRVTLTNKGSSTGNANITGIPFSSNAGGHLPIVPFACWYSSFTGVTRGQVIIGRIDNNSAGIELRFLDGNNEAVLNDTHLTNSSTVAISGTYYTTS